MKLCYLYHHSSSKYNTIQYWIIASNIASINVYGTAHDNLFWSVSYVYRGIYSLCVFETWETFCTRLKNADNELIMMKYYESSFKMFFTIMLEWKIQLLDFSMF